MHVTQSAGINTTIKRIVRKRKLNRFACYFIVYGRSSFPTQVIRLPLLSTVNLFAGKLIFCLL